MIKEHTAQIREEKRLGIEMLVVICDEGSREVANKIVKGQIKFLKLIKIKMIGTWNQFCPTLILLRHEKENTK